MPEWLAAYVPEGWSAGTLVAVSIGFAVLSGGLSIFLVGWAILRIPGDYFIREHVPPTCAGRPAWIRYPAIVGKNVLGGVLVVLGIIMSLPGVPGQGLLTILLGIMLLDVPAKRGLERRIVSRPAILRAINTLRTRYGRTPIRAEP